MFVILNYWDHKLGVTNTIEMVESRFSLRTSTPQLQMFFFLHDQVASVLLVVQLTGRANSGTSYRLYHGYRSV